MIVDDERVALTTMAMILGAEHQVVKAASAGEALSAFRPGEFAVVISDLKMPGRSGIELLEEIAKLDSSCARILLTGYGHRESIIDAVNRARIFMYLDKPCDPGTLQFAVRRAAELSILEAQRRQLTERLDAMEKIAGVGRFAASVAHDIKNYLVPIFAVADERDPEEMAEALTTAKRASEAILALVTEMQALAKGVRPTYRLRAESIVEITREAAEWLKRSPAYAQTALSIEASEVPDVLVAEGRMRRVLINLIKNALEAAGPGGRVAIEVARKLGDAVVTIGDDGPGMSAEVAARCTEPFFSTKGDQGTGLGLYISKAIVAGHGGTLGIDTSPGEGTRITLKLPLA